MGKKNKKKKVKGHGKDKEKRDKKKKKKSKKDKDKPVIGLVKNRSCTDIICLAVFLLFLAGWVGAAVFAYKMGDPRKLFYPTNSTGHLCNEGDNAGKKFSLYFNILSCLSLSSPVAGCPTVQTCVMACPNETFVPTPEALRTPGEEREIKHKLSPFCVVPVSKSSLKVSQLIGRQICPSFLVKSVSVLDRCLPDFNGLIDEAGDGLKDGSGRVDEELQLPQLRAAVGSIGSWSQTEGGEEVDSGAAVAADTSQSQGPIEDRAVTTAASATAPTALPTTVPSAAPTAVPSAVPSAMTTAPQETSTTTPTTTTSTTTTVPSTTAGISESCDQISLKCLREATDLALEVLGARDFFFKALADIKNTWPIVLGCLGISLVLALVWIFLLRYLTKIIVWTTIFFFLICLGLIAAFAFWRRKELIDSGLGQDFSASLLFGSPFSAWPSLLYDFTTTWMVLGIVFAILFGITLLMVIFLRNRIAVAIVVLKTASKAVISIKSTILFPLFPVIFQTAFVLFFLAVGIYLASAAEPMFKVNMEECVKNGKGNTCQNSADGETLKMHDDCDPKKFNCSNCAEAMCNFFRYGSSWYVIIAHCYNIFGVLWSVLCTKAFSELVLAGAFVTWYFVLDKHKHMPSFILTRSLCRTLRYHMGTAAFGSFIIAVIKVVRMLVEYIDRKLREGNKDNPVVKGLMMAFKCCLWAFEKCMKFLNTNAYIMTAIHGINFCSAAKKAFLLLLKNIVRVAVLSRVSAFITYISKVTIMVATVAVAYAIFTTQIDMVKAVVGPLNYFYVPVVLVAIGSYFTADVVIEVYEMAVDTIFLCFLEDLEVNDGTKKKPYFMPKSMQKVVKKFNDEGSLEKVGVMDELPEDTSEEEAHKTEDAKTDGASDKSEEKKKEKKKDKKDKRKKDKKKKKKKK